MYICDVEIERHPMMSYIAKGVSHSTAAAICCQLVVEVDIATQISNGSDCTLR
jgi:hypothetical protein